MGIRQTVIRQDMQILCESVNGSGTHTHVHLQYTHAHTHTNKPQHTMQYNTYSWAHKIKQVGHSLVAT